MPVALLLLEDGVAPGLEIGKAAIDPARDPAVEPNRCLRKVFQEAPIVADEHDGGAEASQLGLEPFDRRQVEVIGRLVQEQDVRLRREHPRERGAPGFAAGEIRRRLLARQPELIEDVARAMRIVARSEPRLDISERRRMAGEVRLLRQIADGRARLREAAAAVRLGEAGRDLQERRLARAVAPDEAGPLAGPDGELRLDQERRSAEGQGDVPEVKERRGDGGKLRESDVRRRRAYIAAQFSTCNPGTRRNSRSLLVTSVKPAVSAWAAIQRSLLPIVSPLRSSVARIEP